MKSLALAIASLLIAAPAMAHPRSPRTNWTYSYPEKDVMVRRDWRRCEKIKYITKYDKHGWYTERKVTPLRSCWKHSHHHRKPQIKVIIK